ncbi:HlyD family efflux transporter periplasmic adaptor subunit [Desulfovibrio sp. OttesenSCG-928-G15]|nr:HlyD family efflux transporter periplasmic adaptor subunit [Desulfovibrio sp. OttesenSCG-928-G15]
MKLTMPEAKKSSGTRKWLYAVVAGLAFCAAGGGVYWHFAGRVPLDGLFLNTNLPVSARQAGRVQSVGVTVGDAVRQGDVLVTLDPGNLKQVFEQQRQKLKEIEMLLPPSMMQAQGAPVAMPGQLQSQVQGQRHGLMQNQMLHQAESLTQKLERLRSEEVSAQRRVDEASSREAQAAVYYNRVALQVARGRMHPEDRNAADVALQMARAETEKAKKAFEAVSLQRFDAGKDIQKVKDIQAASGADMVPETLRLKQYEDQRQRLLATMQAMEDTRLTAPEDGVVLDVIVQAGANVEAMQPCVVLRPTARPPLVRALAEVGDLAKLMLGQEAEITLKGPQDVSLSGFVSGFAPPSRAGDTVYTPDGQPKTVVWITLDTPQAQEARDRMFAMPQGSMAEVEVALRKQPRRLAPQPQAMGYQTPGYAQGNAYGNGQPAAAPAVAPTVAPGTAPVAVPVVRAGSAEAQGITQPGQVESREGQSAQPLPRLPRMQPSGPVSGPAPAAQPDNNPSLASPQVLQGADSAKPLIP